MEKEHPDKYQEVEKMVATNTFAENLFVNQTPSKELKGAVAKNGCFGCALPALSILFLLLIFDMFIQVCKYSFFFIYMRKGL